MKQLARYTILFDSKACVASSALMGVAIFFQAIYFFVIRNILEVSAGDLVLYFFVPMLLELAWILLLHSFKLNASGIYGILGSMVCVLLTVQVFLSGSPLQMVLGIIAYLIGISLLLLITGGFFPYKYFGMAWFAVIGVVRFCCFDMDRFIRAGDFRGFALEFTALCAIFSIAAFFGGISGVRIKKESNTPCSE